MNAKTSSKSPTRFTIADDFRSISLVARGDDVTTLATIALNEGKGIVAKRAIAEGFRLLLNKVVSGLSPEKATAALAEAWDSIKAGELPAALRAQTRGAVPQAAHAFAGMYLMANPGWTVEQALAEARIKIDALRTAKGDAYDAWVAAQAKASAQYAAGLAAYRLATAAANPATPTVDEFSI